ncbi:MAG: glycosyl hydrolase [Acidimicrobiales bacterium]
MSSTTAGMLLVGTRKGVFTVRGDAPRDTWTVSDPTFLGHIAQHVMLDPRNAQRMVLATRTGHLGPTVFHSDDLGATWTEATRPPAFRAGDQFQRSVQSVFWLTPGHADEPGVWYAGGTPQGLFVSHDGGATWDPVDGWNDNPMWATWAEWPEQNTPDGSMLHSIIIDPRDAAHMYIALSSGGVFETTDRGNDWRPLNAGCEIAFLPETEPEFGHDPHCVRLHPLQPDRLYQQNHCGIYRMDRGDARWVRIGNNMPSAVGDIGFPIELHPRDPDTAWVFPMDGTDVWPRTSPDGHPAVYRTRDAGESWTRCDNGLPATAWFTVKRQAMTVDHEPTIGVYFGTTSGEIWSSTDEGTSWQCIASHLPEIYSLEYASLS